MWVAINIDENLYTRLFDNGADFCYTDILAMATAIRKGTVLPKGHGKLKDIDKFIERAETDRKHACYLHGWTADDVIDYLSSDSYAPIVVEADKKELEELDFVQEHKKIPVTLNLISNDESFMNKACVSGKVCEHDKQKVLEKMRAEIEQLTSRYTISREHGCMGHVEWEDRLIKESDILQMIDKYRKFEDK